MNVMLTHCTSCQLKKALQYVWILLSSLFITHHLLSKIEVFELISSAHTFEFLFFQSRGDSGHRRNGMYYGTPFYGGYGYASPLPHPNMYAAAYGAYPYYGNQQLVS